jgi:hypothetical protein
MIFFHLSAREREEKNAVTFYKAETKIQGFEIKKTHEEKMLKNSNIFFNLC